MALSAMPELDGVVHRFIEVGDGVTIHVADAGAPNSVTVMLIHGFPQNWWLWHQLIQPLTEDGLRVLCPDLRGAGWSSVPRGRYYKSDMADDLAIVLERLDTGPVHLVGHDWGGPVAFLLMLRHPKMVRGFFGLNTVGPWYVIDDAFLRGLWSLWYQLALSLPVLGQRLIGDSKGRFLAMLSRWLGAGFVPEDMPLYIQLMGDPSRALAASRWYRTAQCREIPRWLRGQYAQCRIDVPVRLLRGAKDPVITSTLLRGYNSRMSDLEVETIQDVGHWIVEERPELVLQRLRTFVLETS
ncbi:epoxide hydrolase [Mycobacterium sp. 1165196.3]|uniref:alpha/beta fold hydrolase n=1 Tax=Mycobacterium sp. 1165196.3 TaxID=1834071 RepID=UPI0007FF9C3B|nr:alpha/beta hydrolase [Mycobacterium sp. 1165196.3]OBK37716.1 epoxide hydrolase [Mycobacterium sp. 1165196.3]